MSQSTSNDGSPYRAITQQVFNGMPSGQHTATYRGTLLDRLSSVSNSQVAESTVARGELQLSDIKASILRELTWLLNTNQLETTVELSSWPAVQQSVLNYGVPQLAGKWEHFPDRIRLERDLAKIIQTFEPRLAKGSVQVSITQDDCHDDTHTLLMQLDAECQIVRQKLPLRIQARLDAETGQLSVLEEI